MDYTNTVYLTFAAERELRAGGAIPVCIHLLIISTSVGETS